MGADPETATGSHGQSADEPAPDSHRRAGHKNKTCSSLCTGLVRGRTSHRADRRRGGAMANRCMATDAKPRSGNNGSHSRRPTKRRFMPNIPRRRCWLPSEQRFGHVWAMKRVSAVIGAVSGNRPTNLVHPCGGGQCRMRTMTSTRSVSDPVSEDHRDRRDIGDRSRRSLSLSSTGTSAIYGATHSVIAGLSRDGPDRASSPAVLSSAGLAWCGSPDRSPPCRNAERTAHGARRLDPARSRLPRRPACRSRDSCRRLRRSPARPIGGERRGRLSTPSSIGSRSGCGTISRTSTRSTPVRC